MSLEAAGVLEQALEEAHTGAGLRQHSLRSQSAVASFSSILSAFISIELGWNFCCCGCYTC